jgi:lipopolysaccharide export system protein LptA
MRKIALIGSILVAVAFAVNAAPATAPSAARGAGFGLDSSQPIAVNADSFFADLNGETGVYAGNVIVSQGQVRLHADEVKISAPGGRASRMEATGHVVVDSPSGQAIGESGVYDVVAQMLRLTGNVVLTKDANVMRGSALEVSMATGLARLTAGGEGQTQTPGRVQGLFVPAQRGGAAAPSAGTAPPRP